MIDSLAQIFVEINTPTKLSDSFPTVHIERVYDQNLKKRSAITTLSETGQSTTITNSSSYDTLLGKLYGFLSLKPDWDGYEGTVPSKSTIVAGEILLDKFKSHIFQAPKIMLSGSGEIGFYWENGSEYAEITCDRPDTYTFVYLKDKMTYSEEDRSIEKNFSFDMINKIAVISKTL